MTSNRSPADFKNWLPLKLYREKKEWKLDWVCMQDVQFLTPFFEDTITQFRIHSKTGAGGRFHQKYLYRHGRRGQGASPAGGNDG